MLKITVRLTIGEKAFGQSAIRRTSAPAVSAVAPDCSLFRKEPKEALRIVAITIYFPIIRYPVPRINRRAPEAGSDKLRLSLLGNEATSLHVQPCVRKRDHEYLCVGVTYSGREGYAYNEMV
jgi:hypothetical protein